MSLLIETLKPYEGVLLDVWGVLFDGEAPLAGALEALETIAEHEVPAVLVTNASWPGSRVRKLLVDGGLPSRVLPPLISAGDVAAAVLKEQWPSGRVFVHGNTTHAPLVDGIERVTDPAAADVILGALAQPLPERATLAAARGVPLVCANPDLDAPTASGLTRCAGATAAEYRDLGGPVIICGKPDRRIYRAAAHRLGLDHLLAIGDSIPTDLVGAARAGLDALLINTRDYSEHDLAEELASAQLPSPIAVWDTLRA